MKTLLILGLMAVITLLLVVAIAQERRIEALEIDVLMQDELNDAMIDRLNAIPPEFRRAPNPQHGPPPQVTV